MSGNRECAIVVNLICCYTYVMIILGTRCIRKLEREYDQDNPAGGITCIILVDKIVRQQIYINVIIIIIIIMYNNNNNIDYF